MRRAEELEDVDHRLPRRRVFEGPIEPYGFEQVLERFFVRPDRREPLAEREARLNVLRRAIDALAERGFVLAALLSETNARGDAIRLGTLAGAGQHALELDERLVGSFALEHAAETEPRRRMIRVLGDRFAVRGFRGGGVATRFRLGAASRRVIRL